MSLLSRPRHKKKLKSDERIERVKDEFGRTIGVRKLTSADHVQVYKATGEHEDTPSMRLALAAFSVCEVDGKRIRSPRNKEGLDALISRLDKEGLAAAVAGMQEL